jgi:PBP1b-binding outer membrane lipoprotein LpoB
MASLKKSLILLGALLLTGCATTSAPTSNDDRYNPEPPLPNPPPQVNIHYQS